MYDAGLPLCGPLGASNDPEKDKEDEAREPLRVRPAQHVRLKITCSFLKFPRGLESHICYCTSPSIIIHSAPVQEGPLAYYHWHIEIIPKLTKVAGFEWATGFYINPTPPEESAKFLREAGLG